MLRRTTACLAALASVQIAGLSTLPSQAAVSCRPGTHWVQTGRALGAGTCQTSHHDKHDHYVCALGYHFVGHGRCVRNGAWWKGRRPVQWGPYYEPRAKSGGVSFEAPNGDVIKLKW